MFNPAFRSGLRTCIKRTVRRSICTNDTNGVSTAAARHIRDIANENVSFEIQKGVIETRARDKMQAYTNKLAFLRSRRDVPLSQCDQLQEQHQAERYAAINSIQNLNRRIQANHERIELLDLLRLPSTA